MLGQYRANTRPIPGQYQAYAVPTLDWYSPLLAHTLGYPSTINWAICFSLFTADSKVSVVGDSLKSICPYRSLSFFFLNYSRDHLSCIREKNIEANTFSSRKRRWLSRRKDVLVGYILSYNAGMEFKPVWEWRVCTRSVYTRLSQAATKLGNAVFIEKVDGTACAEKSRGMRDRRRTGCAQPGAPMARIGRSQTCKVKPRANGNESSAESTGKQSPGTIHLANAGGRRSCWTRKFRSSQMNKSAIL